MEDVRRPGSISSSSDDTIPGTELTWGANLNIVRTYVSVPFSFPTKPKQVITSLINRPPWRPLTSEFTSRVGI